MSNFRSLNEAVKSVVLPEATNSVHPKLSDVHKTLTKRGFMYDPHYEGAPHIRAYIKTEDGSDSGKPHAKVVVHHDKGSVHTVNDHENAGPSFAYPHNTESSGGGFVVTAINHAETMAKRRKK